MKPLLIFICLVMPTLCATPAHALLLESWEDQGFSPSGADGDGAWARMDGAAPGLNVSYSRKHATDGSYSLAIYTPGGWEPVLINTRNFATRVNDRSLRQILSEKLMLSADVYTEPSIHWATLIISFQGDDLSWVQMTSDPLHIGGLTKVRLMINSSISHGLRKNNGWFQMMIYVNTAGAGTIYLDNLCAE